LYEGRRLLLAKPTCFLFDDCWDPVDGFVRLFEHHILQPGSYSLYMHVHT